MNGNILIVDDDPDIREILKDCLGSLGCRVSTASDGQDCLHVVEKEGPELVLLDIELPDINGLELLREIRRRGKDSTVIMITAYGTVDRAVQAMKEGAFDFITKPFELDHIVFIVEKALERERLKRGLELFVEQTGERYRLIGGESSKMSQAIDTAKKAAASKSTVLLLGESGTGKEVFARAIHNWSDRRRYLLLCHTAHLTHQLDDSLKRVVCLQNRRLPGFLSGLLHKASNTGGSGLLPLMFLRVHYAMVSRRLKRLEQEK